MQLMLVTSSTRNNLMSSKIELTTTVGSDASVKDSEPDKEKPRRGRRRLFHDEEQRKARRKAQCKLNQRKYRARQKGRISTLSLETEGLNEHLQDLRDFREFLKGYFQPDYNTHVNQDVRPILVVKYFYWAFRVGFALHSAESSALQENFIRLVCVPDVIAQGAMTNGIEALLLQLKRYTSCHGSFEIRAEDVKVVYRPNRQVSGREEDSMWIVQAKGSVKLRISRDTLMVVFPHVLRDHDSLAQQIVGQTIDPEFSADFYFNANAKVTKLDQSTDFTGAFYRLLGSAEDVITLINGALISPFSELGLDPQGTIRPSSTGCKQLSLKFILGS